MLTAWCRKSEIKVLASRSSLPLRVCPYEDGGRDPRDGAWAMEFLEPEEARRGKEDSPLESAERKCTSSLQSLSKRIYWVCGHTYNGP